MAMMDDPIDNRTGKLFIIKDSVPFTELQIGSNNKAFTFITV